MQFPSFAGKIRELVRYSIPPLLGFAAPCPTGEGKAEAA